MNPLPSAWAANHAMLDRIDAAVCRAFRIPETMLHGRTKRAQVVWPRHVAMYLALELTSCPQLDVSERYGLISHGAAWHAHRKVQDLMSVDARLKAEVEAIRAAAFNGGGA